MRNSPDRRRPQCFVVYLAAVSVSLAVLVVSITGWVQDPETRIALVIGNGYGGELRNPPNDAQLIATTLRKFSFTLVEGQPLIDADQKVMKRANNFGSHRV